jgi:hypothetical protein
LQGLLGTAIDSDEVTRHHAPLEQVAVEMAQLTPFGKRLWQERDGFVSKAMAELKHGTNMVRVDWEAFPQAIIGP